jgi:hypothetical protein
VGRAPRWTGPQGFEVCHSLRVNGAKRDGYLDRNFSYFNGAQVHLNEIVNDFVAAIAVVSAVIVVVVVVVVVAGIIVVV